MDDRPDIDEATCCNVSNWATALTAAYVEERREIREEYRKLFADVCESVDGLNIATVNKDVKKADQLVEKVLLPREGTFDSSLLKQCSEVLHKKSGNLQTGPKFSADLYARRLVAFMKNMNPEDVRLPCDDSESDGDEATELTEQNWETLNEFFAPCFKTAPGFTYLYGAFPETENEAVPARKTERQKRGKSIAPDQPSTLVKPTEISECHTETEDQRTARKIKIIREYLNIAYDQTNGQPINYYDFLVHPTSFGKTVENMFYFTFLLKDGFAQFWLDEKSRPYIKPTVPAEPKANRPSNSSHIVTSITWDQWEKIVKLFGITEAFLDLGE